MNLIDVAVQCLQTMGLPHTRVPNMPVINLPVETDTGKLNVYIHAHTDSHRLFIYSRPQDLPAPIERIQELALFLTRVNYGLPLGNFEIDLNDGEYNFKQSVDVSDGVLSEKMVQNMLVFSLECYNRYLPGIRAVIDGSAAKPAIEAIDGPTKIQIR